MIVKLEQNPNQKDLEVLIRYARMNQAVRRLEILVRAFDKAVRCSCEDKEIWVNASDIYYIESVDKKTFVYCGDEVYSADSRLYQMLDELSDFGFVQINKSCILNIHVLKSIRPLINSRMEASLSNGEKVNVTRKYVSEIKRKLTER